MVEEMPGLFYRSGVMKHVVMGSKLAAKECVKKIIFLWYR